MAGGWGAWPVKGGGVAAGVLDVLGVGAVSELTAAAGAEASEAEATSVCVSPGFDSGATPEWRSQYSRAAVAAQRRKTRMGLVAELMS